jgi:hypothetical protein
MLNHYFGSCGLSQESREDFAAKLGEKAIDYSQYPGVGE